MRAAPDLPAGTYLYLTTTDGDVLLVQFLGMGGIRAFSDKGRQVPWVEACEAKGLYAVGSKFRTGWDRLSRSKPRKQTSQ